MPEIALIRAVAEVAQSRVGWIHGGRDDLTHQEEQLALATKSDLIRDAETRFTLAMSAPEIHFDQIAGVDLVGNGVGDLLDSTLSRLASKGVRHVCRTMLTQPNDPLQVARVIVPTLEHFDHHTHRVGRRLHEAIVANG